MILVTFSVVVTIVVLNVNFRTPATQKMAPWVKKTFVDFLPKYLFIERPDDDEDEEGDIGQLFVLEELVTFSQLLLGFV